MRIMINIDYLWETYIKCEINNLGEIKNGVRMIVGCLDDLEEDFRREMTNVGQKYNVKVGNFLKPMRHYMVQVLSLIDDKDYQEEFAKVLYWSFIVRLIDYQQGNYINISPSLYMICEYIIIVGNKIREFELFMNNLNILFNYLEETYLYIFSNF